MLKILIVAHMVVAGLGSSLGTNGHSPGSAEILPQMCQFQRSILHTKKVDAPDRFSTARSGKPQVQVAPNLSAVAPGSIDVTNYLLVDRQKALPMGVAQIAQRRSP